MAWRYLVGLLVGIVALGFILERMYFPALQMFVLLSQWWPLVIIILSANYLIRRRDNPWGTLLLIGLGIVLLVRQQDLNIYGPDVLVFVGAVILLLFALRLMLPAVTSMPSGKSGVSPLFRPTMKDFVIFGGRYYRNESQQFQGGLVNTVMGDYEVDLRKAVLSPEGGELEIRALFASVVIRIPPEMNVSLEGKPFLGGLENRARTLVPDEPGRPTLVVRCHATLSAVTLTN